MSARFFADETDLALGRALDAARGGVLYPGHPELPEVPRGSQDDDWLQVVGRLRLVVITRDRRIRYRPAEQRLWISHLVRGFVLTGQRSQSTEQSLDILDRHWTDIVDLVESRRRGPWMYAITETALSEISLRV